MGLSVVAGGIHFDEKSEPNAVPALAITFSLMDRNGTIHGREQNDDRLVRVFVFRTLRVRGPLCDLRRSTRSGLAQPPERADRRLINPTPHGPSGEMNRESKSDAYASV